MDGRIQFVYATCGRKYFCIRIKKFADTKISGYMWTGPKYKKGNCGFGHFDSTDFLPVSFKYILFCEFQVKSCVLLIIV